MGKKDVKVRVDKGRLFLDFYYNGTRVKEYLNLSDNKTNRKYAENLANKISFELLTDTFNYVKTFPNSKEKEKGHVYPFLEYLNKVFEQIEQNYKSNLFAKGTFETYRSAYNLFVGKGKLKEKVKCSFLDKILTEITALDIKNYISLLSQYFDKKTIKNKLILMRKVFEFACVEEILNNDAMEHKIVKKAVSLLREKNKKEIDPFTPEEVKMILEEAEKRYPHIVLFFAVGFYLGMRTGEILAMKWENFDFNSYTYYVKESRTAGILKEPKTKKSKRILVIPDGLKYYITKHKQYSFLKSDFVFINYQGQPYTKSANINDSYWKPLLKKLGIRYRDMYQMRHTHAILSIIAGDNPHDVAKRLGHTSLQMLYQHYGKFLNTNIVTTKIDTLFNNDSVRKLSENNISKT